LPVSEELADAEMGRMSVLLRLAVRLSESATSPEHANIPNMRARQVADKTWAENRIGSKRGFWFMTKVS
jgi:hypothetical protein